MTGARSLSPFLGGRMIAAHLLGKAVFIRELLPQDLKLEIEHLSQNEAIDVAEFLAHVVGRGHAQQLNTSDRTRWLGGYNTIGQSLSMRRPGCGTASLIGRCA